MGATTTSPVDSSRHRHHLLDEQRIPARRALDLPRSSPGMRSGISSATSSSARGSSRRVTGHAGRRTAKSGRAMHSSRIGRRPRTAEPRARSGRGTSPRPTGYRRRRRAAAARRSLLESLAERPGELLRGCRHHRSHRAASESRAAAAVVGRPLGELLQHLDDRPVGDPFAVRQAASSHDPRLDRGEQLGSEARLADAGVADDRHQLATLLGPHTRPCVANERQLALASDELRLVTAAPARRARSEAGKREPARPCL